MPRGGNRPPTKGAVVLRPLADGVLDTLFRQSVIGSYKGEPYIEGVRRLARLIEAELQAQIYETEHSRQVATAGRQSRKRLSADERSVAQQIGQQARRKREAAVLKQQTV